MAVFDAVVNNADRKIGHLLPLPTGTCTAATTGSASARVQAAHGAVAVAGRSLPGRRSPRCGTWSSASQTGELTAELSGWLTADEVTATRQRLELLLKHRVHPYPPEDWPAPWPPI